MKIAYLVHLNLQPGTGVYKKIVAQARTWALAGHDVIIFCVTRLLQVKEALSQERLPKFHGIRYKPGYINFADRIIAMNQLVKAIIKWQPDVVYTRQDLYYPPIAALAKKLPLVQEVNTNIVEELALYSKAQRAYFVITRRLIDRNLAGLVFVTRELSNLPYYKRHFKVPKAVIGNGVDFNEIPWLPLPRHKKPTLIFLGQHVPWAGIEKIIDMANLFPDWDFHLVGVNQKSFSCFLKNVYLYEPMEFRNYLPIAERSHIGIGSLTLYRNKMKEASPLKVREYLALGLPVIIGYEDTDFPDNASFIFRLSNTEHILKEEVERLKEFVGASLNKRVSRDSISFLDYKIKEKERLLLFESAIKHWRQNEK